MLSFYLTLIDDEPSRLLFEELYLVHRHTMIYAANRILHDQMLAEDATHDAFMRILNHLEKISDPHCHKTRSFVVLIVRNIALDYYRRIKRLAETSFDENEIIFEDQDMDPAANDFAYVKFQSSINRSYQYYATITNKIL